MSEIYIPWINLHRDKELNYENILIIIWHVLPYNTKKVLITQKDFSHGATFSLRQQTQDTNSIRISSSFFALQPQISLDRFNLQKENYNPEG
jgi:hypothetical protein